MTQCPWTIRASVDITVQCGRNKHGGDPHHRGKHTNPAAANGYTVISWLAGDRREYTGEWPGPCDKTPGCVLHLGHRGRCAT